MIKQYLNFTKNNIQSRDMGVSHVSLSSGLYEDNIGSNRNLVEQTNNQTDRRYFKRISRDPIEFEMDLLLEEDMTDVQIDSIFTWLLNEYYEELYFEDEVDRIYYCLPISQPKLFHNGNNEGYITIQFRCFDAYLYSREFTQSFDLSTNPIIGTTVDISNEGIENYPLVTILAKESNITILNVTTNESTELTGILVGETITLDSEKEEVISDAGVYRYANHNDVFIRILPPSNSYKITGKCIITFKYRYKRKF